MLQHDGRTLCLTKPVCWGPGPYSRDTMPPPHSSPQRARHSVGLALELQQPPVVHQPLEDLRRQVLVTEHHAPMLELKIRPHRQAALLMPIGNHPEQQQGTLITNRQIPEFVNDQQLVLGNRHQFLIQTTFSFGAARQQPVRGEEPGRDAPTASCDRKCRGQIRLAELDLPRTEPSPEQPRGKSNQ